MDTLGVDRGKTGADLLDDLSCEAAQLMHLDSEPFDDYPGGETSECTYLFVESVCENHPSPPGNCPEGLFQASAVLIDGGPELEELLIEKIHSVDCSVCDGDMDQRTVRGEWPLTDPTTDDVLEVFRESNGQIVLECYPRDYDRRFYIGEIGGRYHVETEHYENPDLPTGEDDLPALVRDHPTTLSSVDETPLEGAYEDYCNGVGR